MNYDDMEAGPELDALILVKVFGHDKATARQLVEKDPRECLGAGYRFSRDIGAAWEVVEKLGGGIDVRRYVLEDSSIIYGAKMQRYGEAPSLPLAICRAALRACS